MYSGGEKLREIHKQKLRQELIKYSKQIGIEEIPCLIFNPNEYIRRIEDYYRGKADTRTIKKVKSHGAGRCHEQSKTIFLNQNCRGYSWEFDRNKNGEKVKHRMHGQTYFRKSKVKINYNFWKKVLVHELVHYRFDQLQHGAKFEKRIREILCGRVFPAMNPIPTVAAQPQLAVTIEDEDEYNKVYSYVVNRTQIAER